MDCYREGGAVTWIDEGFYTALQDMAAMEQVWGDPTGVAVYAHAARQYPAWFDRQLWNSATGRYAGWRDRSGVVHDYGFTYLNLEALARGLGDADKAYAIFQWLDHGQAQPTVAGGHIGSTDIYQCLIAPRSNTQTIPAPDWDSWSVSPALRRTPMGYGALVEDGGAMLWVNYYDVTARLKWLDADSAWDKLDALLRRVAADPLRFTEDVTNPTNAYGENYLEVGPADGSENGIAGVTPLTGFMGVQARADGLYAAPDLPTCLLRLSCHGICYEGAPYTVSVSRGKQVAEITPGSASVLSAGPFNTIIMRPARPGEARVTLQKRIGKHWAEAATAAVHFGGDDCAIPLPSQTAGLYRIMVIDPNCRGAIAQEELVRTGSGVVRGRTLVFTTPKAFSRFTLQTPAHILTDPTLLRRMGTHWRIINATWSTTTSSAILAFADQPAGSYRVDFRQSLMGSYALSATNYKVMAQSKVTQSFNACAGQSVRLAPAFNK